MGNDTLQRMIKLRLVLAATALTVAAGSSGCSLFGGSTDAVADLRAYVQREVTEPERAAKMLLQVELLEAGIQAYNTVASEAGTEIQQLNRDYDATRDQFEALLSRHNTARIEARDVLLASAFRLRDLASEAEWKEIAELEIRAYGERLAMLAKSQEGDK